MAVWILQFLWFWERVAWRGLGGYQTCQHLLRLRAPGLGAPRFQGAPWGDTGDPFLPDISGEGGSSHLGEEGNRQVT